MATTIDQLQDTVDYASPESARELFDDQARKLLNISGAEFLRKWDAGEYRDIVDAPGHRQIMRLAVLIPFGRSKS